METLIAKRYVKALSSMMDAESLANTAMLFAGLAEQFKDKDFAGVIHNPQIQAEAKAGIVLAAAAAAQNDAITNLLKLLAEKGRLTLIPAMAEVLRLEVAENSKMYAGNVYSNTDVDTSVLEALSTDIGKKMGATISLQYVPSDYDGIKVEVEDLGVEVSLSKQRINTQLIEHILKAI